MLISQKQLTANRKNAAKSTGPKTAEGKAAVRHNAAKHGLYARSRIIRTRRLTEDPAEYSLALNILERTFNPKGFYEHAFVEKIADCLWRLRRARRAETYVMTRHMRILRKIEQAIDISFDDDIGECHVDYRRLIDFIRFLIAPDCRVNIIRHRNRIRRRMTKAYSLLDRLQTRHIRSSTGQKEESKKNASKQTHFDCPTTT